jgi:hypothetical protein
MTDEQTDRLDVLEARVDGLEAIGDGLELAELERDGIADALARAQATFETPKKSRTVRVQTRESGTYTFAYAELADVLAAVEPSLTREGIALTQPPTVDLERKTIAITTELRRGSETLSFGPLELPIARLDVQGIGSAITYGRRSPPF